MESRAPVLTTTTCGASGELGTLVTAEVGIRVVAGITVNPETCESTTYAGCVVSRRTLTYLPHQTQSVIVELTSDCIGNGCDLNHTCVEGSCTDTVTATAPVSPDGGVVSGPTVRCGDDGTRCPVNDPMNACCVTFDLDARTGKGACMAAAMCPSTSAVLYSDGDSDCPASEAGLNECVLVNDNLATPQIAISAACTVDKTEGAFEVVCQDRQPCPLSGNACGVTAAAPGYFSCQD